MPRKIGVFARTLAPLQSQRLSPRRSLSRTIAGGSLQQAASGSTTTKVSTMWGAQRLTMTLHGAPTRIRTKGHGTTASTAAKGRRNKCQQTTTCFALGSLGQNARAPSHTKVSSTVAALPSTTRRPGALTIVFTQDLGRLARESASSLRRRLRLRHLSHQPLLSRRPREETRILVKDTQTLRMILLVLL